MSPSPTPSNGHAAALHPVPSLDNLLARVRNGDNRDPAMFLLFAELAEQAGRGDLAAELRRRSEVTESIPAPPAATPCDPAASARADQGLASLRDGRFSEAEAAFRDAVRIDPRYAVAHTNLGVALARQKRFSEAEAAFQLVVRLDPTAPAGYANLGSACLDRGKWAEAESWFRQACHLDPNSAGPRRLLGTALEAQNQKEAAEVEYRQAIQLEPKHADTHHRLGVLLAALDRKPEAERCLREAVRLDPRHQHAHHRLALVFEQQERFADAEPFAREAVRFDPTSADSQNLLGVVLAGLDRHEEAAGLYREAVRLKPDFTIALSNLGNTLRMLGELDGAERSLREAVRLQPRSPEVRNNLGIVLVQGGRVEEGLAEYDEALRMRPDYAEAHLNKSLALLAKGEFAEGWSEYEWRFKLRGGGPKSEIPRWVGKPVEGTILLKAEQGLGDTIHFVRYAALVRERCSRVIVEAQGPVAKLVETCPGVDEVLVNPPSPPSADAHCHLVGLPALLGVPPETRVSIPYLKAPAARVEHWKRELSGIVKRKVGIVWQGSKVHKGDRLRSVSLQRFLPLGEVPNVQLISLQKSPGIEQLAGISPNAIVDLGSRTEAGMEDAAAAIENLDLLVAVDTALAHVAGALGKPVWVAVPFAADWRWLRSGEDTAWYPSMRLFRQPTTGDWSSAFARMKEELEIWAAR